MDLAQIALQSGGVGIGIFAVYVLYRLAGNHIDHNTEVLEELKDAIKDLMRFLEKNR